MSKITKSIAKSFSRLRDNNTKRAALQGAFVDPSGALCACDGFMMARLYNGADAPALADVPRAAADPLHARLLDTLQKVANSGAEFAASAARADYHGSAPVLSAQELRAFSRWSVKNHGGDTFPVGGSFVSAARLALMLDILPDACIYAPASPIEPLYLSGANGDGLLLPVRVQDPKAARARLDEYTASIAAPAPAADPVQPAAPSADFVPSSIRDAVENTPETPVKVIGYKSDGNTVCIHRVRAHHVVDNVYVYATQPDKYGYLAWRFVSLFACGYAFELDCVQDNTRYAEEPTASGNTTSFHGSTLVDFLRALNASFADASAFVAHVESSMKANMHIKLSFVRMLEVMGGQAELITRVMDYRQQREHARQQAQEAREAARIEAEKQEEQQRQQEHERALADCRATLLSEGERMPVDGALLCELAASLGVPVSLKLKGWIMNKLSAISIENGHMVMYTYQRCKKTEKGSTAFWPFMHAVLEALHQQEQQQEQSAQEEAPEEVASAEELAHLFAQTNTPKLENQSENLENSPEPDASACIPSDALQRLAGLSSGTLSTLMRQKGQPDDDKYKAIEAFHQRILFVAQSLAPVEDETWMQLFEHAYSVAYTPAASLDERDPLPASAQDDTQDNTQGAAPEAGSVIASGAYTPKLQNHAANPANHLARDGHTLPHTFTSMRQMTMFGMINTS